MAKLFESMKETTGVDLAEIMKADTYDAKVNRNVNLTGAPDIILGSGQKALNPNRIRIISSHKFFVPHGDILKLVYNRNTS